MPTTSSGTTLKGRFVVRAGTEVTVFCAGVCRLHRLKHDLEASDARETPPEDVETGFVTSRGSLSVERGGSLIAFRSRDLVDVTPCTCHGRGVTLEATEFGAGGRSKCCLNCTHKKK
jgi:hypothetical protein